MAPRYPSIPEPTLEPTSLRDSILSIKQMLEILTGQRGNTDYAAVIGPQPDIISEASGIEVTPVGNIASTDVQAALQELDTEKVAKAGDTMTGFLVLHADPDAAMKAATKQYADTKLSVAGGQTTTGGFRFTTVSLGNSASITPITPNAYAGNYQFIVNNGACSILTPAADSALDILVTNVAGAGGITFTGFAVGVGKTGDALTLVNGDRFIISIRRIAGISTYVVKALQ